MSTPLRNVLFQKLRELGNLYCRMRLGQLVLFVQSVACDDGQQETGGMADEAFIKAIEEHHQQHASQAENAHENGAPSPARLELFLALQELSNRYPDCSFGQLVMKVAEMANTSVYDVEDEQLLRAVRKHLERLSHLERVIRANARSTDDEAFAQVTGGGLGYWDLASSAECVNGLLEVVFTYRNQLIANLAEPIEKGLQLDDSAHVLAFYEVACSQVVAGAFAPLVESMLYVAAKSFAVEFRENGPVARFQQLLCDLDLHGVLGDSSSWLEAFYAYRNKSIHCGYEWPSDSREEFVAKVKKRGWESWFNISLKDEKPWLISMTDGFIKLVQTQLETVATALRRVQQGAAHGTA